MQKMRKEVVEAKQANPKAAINQTQLFPCETFLPIKPEGGRRVTDKIASYPQAETAIDARKQANYMFPTECLIAARNRNKSPCYPSFEHFKLQSCLHPKIKVIRGSKARLLVRQRTGLGRASGRQSCSFGVPTARL